MLDKIIYTYLFLYVLFVGFLITSADIDWSMGYNDYKESHSIQDVGEINIASFDKMDEKYDLRLDENVTLTYDGDKLVEVTEAKNKLTYTINHDDISEELAYNKFKEYSEIIVKKENRRVYILLALVSFGMAYNIKQWFEILNM